MTGVTERIIVLLIVYCSVFLYDSSLLKSSSDKGEKAVYIVFIIISVYLSVSYAANLNFIGFYEVVDLTLTGPARAIEKWLTVPKP